MAPTYTLLAVTSAVQCRVPECAAKVPGPELRVRRQMWKCLRHKISKITQPLQVLPTMKEDTILEKIVTVFVHNVKILKF